MARAVQVLLHVAGASDGARATDVAHALGLPVPTAHHLLSTLVAEGMLRKDTRRRYWLGHKVGILADALAHHQQVPQHRMAALRELAGRTGETAYLTAWRQEEIGVLAIVEGGGAGAGRVPTGYQDHGHARSTGKVLLAHTTADARRAYLDVNPLTAVTPRTITDPAAFEAELARVRARGYAEEDEELRAGLACVSAPLMEGDRVVAAVTVSAPAERFRARREDLVAAVLAAARQG